MMNPVLDPITTLAIICLMIFAGFCLWATIKLREALRSIGEILAKQGSIEIRGKQGSKYPDTGESGEAYDVEQKAEKDRTS